MSSQKGVQFCCDPFQCHRKRIRKGLREISERTRTVHGSLNLQIGNKLCTQCRKKVSNLLSEDTEHLVSNVEVLDSGNDIMPSTSGVVSVPKKSDPSADIFVSPDHELLELDRSLKALHESPVVKRKAIAQVNYSKKKFKSITTTVKKKLELISGDSIDESLEEDTPECEIVEQLKEKFLSCSKTSEKILVLTILPKSWSIRKIEHEFQATSYMVRKAKKLVEEKGILSSPNPK